MFCLIGGALTRQTRYRFPLSAATLLLMSHSDPRPHIQNGYAVPMGTLSQILSPALRIAERSHPPEYGTND